jgi:hypothetical protein
MFHARATSTERMHESMHEITSIFSRFFTMSIFSGFFTKQSRVVPASIRQPAHLGVQLVLELGECWSHKFASPKEVGFWRESGRSNTSALRRAPAWDEDHIKGKHSHQKQYREKYKCAL